MTFPENIHQEKKERVTTKTGFTPRELVNRQIQDPDYHVTEEDIANMDISAALTEEGTGAEIEAKGLKNDNAGTSYDVLDR